MQQIPNCHTISSSLHIFGITYIKAGYKMQTDTSLSGLKMCVCFSVGQEVLANEVNADQSSIWHAVVLL